jgi:hypothetical protein
MFTLIDKSLICDFNNLLNKVNSLVVAIPEGKKRSGRTKIVALLARFFLSYIHILGIPLLLFLVIYGIQACCLCVSRAPIGRYITRWA